MRSWENFGIAVFCLLLGVAIGYFGRTPTENVVEKVVVESAGIPVKVVTVEGVQDLRPEREAVNAVVVFDKEVPNGYGLLVLDRKSGGITKLKMTDNHGPNFKWGGPVDRLHTQFSPKTVGLEANDFVGCTARFYSSDFPPEVLR